MELAVLSKMPRTSRQTPRAAAANLRWKGGRRTQTWICGSSPEVFEGTMALVWMRAGL